MRDPVDFSVVELLIAADVHAAKIKTDPEGTRCLHCWSSIPVASP